MKLLAPKDTIKAKQSDEVRRKLKLKQLIDANQQTYEEVKAKIDPKIREIQKAFDSFTYQIQTKKTALLKEIQDLEQRRAEALEPLDAKWLELSEWEALLNELSAKLTAKEVELAKLTSDVQRKADVLQDKLDELANRELLIHRAEIELGSRKEMIRDELLRLEVDKQEFTQYKADRNLEILEHEKRNFDTERLNEIRKDTLDDREKDLDIYKTQLDDRAATLGRGFEELKRKQRG